jgi:hypothetical protein
VERRWHRSPGLTHPAWKEDDRGRALFSERKRYAARKRREVGRESWARGRWARLGEREAQERGEEGFSDFSFVLNSKPIFCKLI